MDIYYYDGLECRLMVYEHFEGGEAEKKNVADSTNCRNPVA